MVARLTPHIGRLALHSPSDNVVIHDDEHAKARGAILNLSISFMLTQIVNGTSTAISCSMSTTIQRFKTMILILALTLSYIRPPTLPHTKSTSANHQHASLRRGTATLVITCKTACMRRATTSMIIGHQPYPSPRDHPLYTRS